MSFSDICFQARYKKKKNNKKKFRELWSPARQQIWPWRRSKVTVKVTTWYHRKGLVTRNTHAKYQSSICNSAKVMAKVKVFVTDGQTDRQRDGWMRINVPMLSRKRGTTSKFRELWSPARQQKKTTKKGWPFATSKKHIKERPNKHARTLPWVHL